LSEHAAPPDAGEPGAVEGSGCVRAGLHGRNIVLIGMMGAGKSSIGRRLGRMLELDFLDADHEIEAAAGMTIPEIFARHGEAYFRDGERRVVARLLEGGPAVIATGGGAWMDARTRELAATRAISVWLKADAEVLLKRVKRRGTRPLLMNADPEGTMRRLLDERAPFYAQADIVVKSRDVPHETMSDEVLDAIRRHVVEGGSQGERSDR
jgi:shikimate kinase